MTDEELIQAEIETDPYHPGPADVRLRRSGVPVWAIIGYYQDVARGDPSVVERDYDISAREVEAALAYYRRYKDAIDARLATNRLTPVG